MKMKITLVLLVILSIKSSASIRMMKTGVGNCPTYSAVQNFSNNKFQGKWFVNQLEQIRRFAPCQMFKFTTTSDDSMKIEGSAMMSDTLDLAAAGKSNAPNSTNPAFMIWTWNFFPLMIDRVTVLDTDYDDYAIIMLCQSYVFFHNEYPILLTRQRDSQRKYTMSEKYKMKLERALPFPVYLEQRYDICRVNEAVPGKEVKTLDIDKTFADFTKFLSTFD